MRSTACDTEAELNIDGGFRDSASDFGWKPTEVVAFFGQIGHLR
jgi:hypothetical protein